MRSSQILKTKKRINEILSNHSGRSFEQIQKDTDRDYYLSSEEARQYGLIDVILTKRAVEPKKEK